VQAVWLYNVVILIKPETKWSINGQAEKEFKYSNRAELNPVAMVWEELFLVVKGQANLEIAGFPRNTF